MLGQKVTCSMLERKQWVRGVISGVPTDILVEKIQKGITGAVVKEVRRSDLCRGSQKDSDVKT